MPRYLNFLLLLGLFLFLSAPVSVAQKAEDLITAAEVQEITGITITNEDLDLAEGVRFDSPDKKFAFNLFFMPDAFDYKDSKTEISEDVDDLGEAAHFSGRVGPVCVLFIKQKNRTMVIEATNLGGFTPPLTLEQMVKIAKLALSRL